MELLCGPAASGKVRLAIDRVLECCADGDGAWLIVPTAADVERARVELAARREIVVGAHVATFHQLTRQIVGDPTAVELVPAAESVIISRLLRRDWPHAAPGDGVFPGWAATAHRRIVQLRAARVAGGEELDRELALLPPGERESWGTLLDSFERILAGRKLRDDAWFISSALSRLRSCRSASEAGLLPIVAYGFDDLLSWQVRLLQAAARLVQVVLSVPFEPGRAVFDRRSALVQRLASGGAKLIAGGAAGFDDPVLGELEQRLYEPTAEPIRSTVDSVVFHDCCGPLQEAEEVVRCVARALLAGVPHGEVAVVTADPRPARRLLEPAFRRAGIPVTFETTRQLADTPAGRAVLELLSAVLEDEPASWFAFARSRISPLDRTAVAEAELLVRDRAEDPAVRSTTGWWLEHAAVGAPFRALWEVRDGTGAVDALVTALRACEVVEPGDVRLLRAVEDVVCRIEQACGQRGPSLSELHGALRELPIAAPARPREGSVVVAPVGRVRTDRFDTVVIFGVHSGGFHSGGEDDESPAIARELGHTALTRARRQMYVVRQAAGSDGGELAPHPFWSELRRLLPDAIHEVRSLDTVVPAPADVVLHSELDRTMALHAAGATGSSTADEQRSHCVSGAVWRQVIGPLERMPVTAIESYLACPARWFIERHLLPSRSGRGALVGQVVHAVLADLMPRVATGELEPAAIDDEQVARVVDRIAAAAGDGHSLRAVDRALVGMIVARALREHESHGSRIHVEQTFGESHDELAALVVDGTQLVGRIDRIDVDDGGNAVVIDYKLGRRGTAGVKLVEEGHLQLPLYWAAIAASATLTPVAAIYRPLRGDRPRGLIDREAGPAFEGGYRTDRLDAEAIGQHVDRARERAADVIGRIRSGQVPPAPRGGTCPRWCRLQGICRVGEAVTP